MPLVDILTDIAMENGLTANDTQKLARIYQVNKAAKEIHTASDLEESLKEEVFDYAVDSQQIALPAYIERVRGMRFFDGRQSISLDDMRNRYNYNFTGENEVWYLQWRKKESSTTCREISNQSVITVSVPLAEEEEFNITFTGKTDKSERISETITFAIGDLEHDTGNNFISLESVVKNKVTKYNVSFYDVEDNLLGEVLNSEYKSVYQVFQIADTESFSSDNFTSGVEVWFKYKFQPFRYDEDCFLGTDKYDDAIVMKYLSKFARNKEDAVLYDLKCKQIMSDLFNNDQAGQRTKINFKPNPFLNLPYTNVGGLTRFRS